MTKSNFFSSGLRRFTILLATAFLFSLASCLSGGIIDDDDPTPLPPDPYGEYVLQTVSLRLVSSETATRGVSRPVCDGEPVQLNHGTLYLVSQTGTIIRYFNITPRGGTATNINNRIINIECLEDGKYIYLVPGTISRVVIVGNSQVSLPQAGNINSLIEDLVTGNAGGAMRNTIATQHNVWNPGVQMFADVILTHISTSNIAPFTRTYGATMTLAPLVARFELAKMTGLGSIESYSVDGIFIDRYYRSMQRRRVFPVGATPINLGSNSVNFQPNAPGGDFIPVVTHNYGVTTRSSGALFTSYSAPGWAAAPRTADGMVVARPAGTTNIGCQGLPACTIDHSEPVPNSWNFQVFARYYRNQVLSAAVTTPPILVIRLRDVVVRTGVGTQTQNLGIRYLTVDRFNRIDANGEQLTNIRASNAYRIPNLTFTERDLTERPNTQPINANITVEVARWNVNEIIPEGFNQPDPTNVSLGCGLAHTFILGEATCGYCARPSAPGNYIYLWEHSLNGGSTWSPAPGANTGANYTTPFLDEERHFRRRATCSSCNRTITSLPAIVDAYCLEVSPTVLLFNQPGGATRMVGVETTRPWTVEPVGALPAWLTITNQTTYTFNVNVVALNPAGAVRTATLRVRAGSLYQYVMITQLGHDIFGTAMPGTWVGAFWRYYQQAERLIRITNANNNGWTALASEDWIKLDMLDSNDPGIFTNPASVSGLANDIAHRLPTPVGMQGSTVSAESGDINFRIGLRSSLLSADSQPRYGMVVLMHNNRTETHIIWIRQGEAADYVMRPDDLMDNGLPRGNMARRWTTHNLTALPEQLNVTSLPPRGGRFAQYPTQTGAFFQWNPTVVAVQRVAWQPDGVLPPNAANWHQNFPGFWNTESAIHETCPPGYRRPNDGPTDTWVTNNTLAAIRLSEVRQSLFLNPVLGIGNFSGANTVFGLYADGFFDRRPRTNHLGTAGGAHPNSTVAAFTHNVARQGIVAFNPRTGASLFFPTSGRRSAGNLRHQGYEAHYSTGTAFGGPGQYWNLNIRMSSQGLTFRPCERRCGMTVRCVAED